ncbi:hypothetical protein KVR01_011735 [Diaporthe batatas]|uniref:uncharacterized protein n=1 Tax=Diaporthe batatas TaxID=748121 RepID=UPI001D03C43E|nr:uncharacterized protein KVR01_011735 [Diaporthe batatas]KAG8158613.1 hypothetical protein KVR01_011735 [Diaporthe batatas]
MASFINNRRLENGNVSENSPLLRESDTSGKARLQARDGSASAWATFGVVCTVIWVQALIRWFASPTEFKPAPILGPDKIATWRLVGFRIFEALNLAVLLLLVWFCLLVPAFPYLRRFKKTDEASRLDMDGMSVIGGFVAWGADGLLNLKEYLFMFNAHGVNRGVWIRFIPFQSPKAATRYAEDLLIGPAMYVYFCEGFGLLGTWLAKPIRRRFPSLTNAGVLGLVWLIEFVADFVIENSAIRLTHVFGYTKTYGPLTLFQGEVHQFPIYESAFVASLGVVHTAMRIKWLDNGVSPVERGYEAWDERLHTAVRTFAVIGMCCAAVIMFYHLPLTWLGMVGDCHAHIPSYMQPGEWANRQD